MSEAQDFLDGLPSIDPVDVTMDLDLCNIPCHETKPDFIYRFPDGSSIVVNRRGVTVIEKPLDLRRALAAQAAGPELFHALDRIERLLRTADPTAVDLPVVAGDIARTAIFKVTGG